MRYQAAIFDLDGTLIDTEGPLIRAGIAALADLGHDVDLEFMLRLVGVGPDEGHEKLCSHIGVDLDRATLDAAWTAAAQEALSGIIPLRPGVAELLATLNAQGTPKAIATNSGTASALRKLASAGIEGQFGAAHVVGHDAVAIPKPAPDVYLAAAARLGVTPAACVAFEDSEPGVAAALAAGMVVVHVPDMAPAETDRAHHRAESILAGARACGLID
ncbi:HAD family hydrolase [Solirhodobacter olei]|uniref:HAD family hydrolase n=1 Tax=Solirhodobacter olei TaxID=2493082 RepID=UPI000FD9C2EF|nr:HAD family phosphatase [Solirhodobacter olei]